MRRTFGKRKKQPFNVKVQRRKGARGLKTFTGRLGRDRLLSAGGPTPPFGSRGINFASWALCTAIREIQSIPRRNFNAEDAAVVVEEGGGGFSLRPLRGPWRPLRLIRLRGSLVASWPLCSAMSQLRRSLQRFWEEPTNRRDTMSRRGFPWSFISAPIVPLRLDCLVLFRLRLCRAVPLR